MKKLSLYILSVFALTVLLGNSVVFANSPSLFRVEAYGIDSIAGFSVPITSSQTLPDKNVVFTIVKPSGEKIVITEKSDENGIARFNLYDYHTRDSGNYSVYARLENGIDSGAHYFQIYSDEVSEINSKISANSLIAKSDGIDKIYVTVSLMDRNGNPIEGHIIEVISSRHEDKIQRLTNQQFTNTNGSLIFALSSSKEGVSIYSFYDSTANKVLTNRLEIAYGDFGDVGGVLGTAFAAAGEVSELVFENLPTSISSNQDVSFTLSAYDSEGVVVPNYTGTVHFSAEGSNSTYASLPNDYTFDIDLDGGSHTFSGINSLNFLQNGTYTIVATDINNFTVTGSTQVVVGSGVTTTTTGHGTSSDTISIISPTPGTYNDSQLRIIGTAPTGSNSVQIFDNDQSIGSASVESDNSFSFQPSILQDGLHSVFATALDSGGAILETTDTVTFTIDTKPPQIENIKFTPASGIKIGQIIDIEVFTDTPVFQGAVVFNVDIAELEADPNNDLKYLASIQAPNEEGTYPVDLILVDELSNEGIYENAASLEISANGGSIITGNEEPIVEEEPTVSPPAEENQPPTDVFGVTATASDRKVTLNWQSASDDDYVDHYRIFYGTNPTNLFMSVDTIDATPTWYIPNLNNGTEYYFAVLAVDSEGLESANRSSVANSIPFSSQPEYTPPVQQYPPLSYYYYSTPQIQSTGPELIWFLLITVGLTQLYFKFRNKLC